MIYPYMDRPLTGHIGSFLDKISCMYECGELGPAAYHVSLGKAMAYVECQFSNGQMSEDAAHMLLHEIERMARL